MGGGSDKWYRLWKSGWLEQGGFHTDGDVASSIILLKPYSNKMYIITTQMIKDSTSSETGNDVTPRIFNQTTTSFGYRLLVTTGNSNQGNRNWSWYTAGQSI